MKIEEKSKKFNFMKVKIIFFIKTIILPFSHLPSIKYKYLDKLYYFVYFLFHLSSFI